MLRFARGGIMRVERTDSVFLTFDDGPEPGVTEPLLDLLDRHGARASFFVIGEKAKRHPALVRRIAQAGHAVGNHSWDHAYGPFFRSERYLKRWIERSHDELRASLGKTPVGFRSPAGIITPPLVRSLRELGIPLIHWNRRFFDTVITFGPRRAERAAPSLRRGDILLLHDGKVRDARTLIDGVSTLLAVGKKRSLDFQKLEPLLHFSVGN